MSTSRLPLLFRFYGVSPWELEVFYSMLHNLFNVEEYPDAEQDEDFTTLIDITFPLEFSESFFKWFGTPRWDKFKDILKEMKRRRGGGKSFRVYIKFAGKPGVKFMIDMEERQSFGTAIDKIDFVLELIPYHLNPEKTPKEITEVSYYFDEMSSRWNINAGAAGDETYHYSKNEWRIT